MVGTITPTDKKSRQDLDVPFIMLSSGALHSVKRGWSREAAIMMRTKSGKIYYI